MVYRFETFQLDDVRCELRRGGVSHTLPRLSVGVLGYLLERAGTVVQKRDLLARFWSQTGASDAAVHGRIREIRKVLGDSSASILKLIRGRGYMIACPVERGSAVKASDEGMRFGLDESSGRLGTRGDRIRSLHRMILWVSLAQGLAGELPRQWIENREREVDGSDGARRGLLGY